MGEQNIATMSQSDLWNGPAGQAWLHMQTLLDSLFEPFEALLVDAVRWHGPHAVLDIGCGTGATTLAIARALAPHGSCTGADLSQMMIDRARQRAAEEADGVHANFRSGDASCLDGAGPFDMVTSRFGVMFFDDPPAAFASLARWLTPDGRFAFATWGPPAENPWMTSLQDVVSAVVDVPPFDPSAPGPFRYARAETLLALLRAAGLRELAVHDWRGKLPVGGGLPAAEAARFAIASFAMGDLLATASEAAREGAARALAERFAAHEHDGIVQLDACVHLFTGRGVAA